MHKSLLALAPLDSRIQAAACPSESLERMLADLAGLAAMVCDAACGAVCLPRDGVWELAALASEGAANPVVDAELCLRVASGPGLTWVADSAEDPRIAQRLGISSSAPPRFCAGVLAIDCDAREIMRLCVFDAVPRELAAAQADSLLGLARQAVGQLALHRRVEQLTAVAAARDGLAGRRDVESRFRAFMDHSPAVAFMKDEAGRYVYVNAPFTRIFNVPDSHWVGRTDEELWPAEVAKRLRETDRIVMAEGRNVELIETVPLPGGEASHWQVYKFPFADAAGRRYLAGIAVNRTEQVDYERRLLEYQSKLEDAVAELQVLATTDGLTQLNNRSAFDTRLLEECERARRGGSRLAVLLIDVDHFKPFNDRYGHPAGDEVLRTVAEILRQTSRATDVVARYGGEEFAMVLPDTDSEGAAILGERCRAAVASAPWADRGVTISVGLASSEGEVVADELLRLADQALYRSKQSGRNRVMGSESDAAIERVL